MVFLAALGERPLNWDDTPDEVQAVRDYDLHRSVILSVPAADVAPVVRGTWVEVTDEVQDVLRERPPYVMLIAYKCSVCGRYAAKMEPYCHCGAKMDGGTP